MNALLIAILAFLNVDFFQTTSKLGAAEERKRKTKTNSELQNKIEKPIESRLMHILSIKQCQF